MESLAKKLKQLREKAELKQIQLGKLIGCSTGTISRIENNQRAPSPAFLSKLLQIYKRHFKWTEDEYNAIYHECSCLLEVLSGSIGPADIGHIDKTSPDYGEYVGKYYMYGFISTGEDRITSHELNIEKILNQFIVRMKGLHHGSEFKGELIVNEQNIFINLDGFTINHGKLLYVFFNPPSRIINKLWGILSAASVINEPMAKVVLLSNHPMKEEIAREEFTKNGYSYQNSVWKIPKDARLFTDNLIPPQN